MISITFKPGSTQKVRDAIKAKTPELVSALTIALNETMTDLMARVQAKLSGEVLQTRRGGGGLLGTVRMLPISRPRPGVLQGGVQGGGGPASAYAAVQEYGGTRIYDIWPGTVTGKSDKQALAFFPTGALGRSREPNFSQKPGGPKTGYVAGLRLYRKTGKGGGTLKPENYGKFADLGGVVVRHVVHPPLPERSYMRSALEEMRSEIIARMKSAIRQTIK
jgi:hypothetical protein